MIPPDAAEVSETNEDESEAEPETASPVQDSWSTKKFWEVCVYHACNTRINLAADKIKMLVSIRKMKRLEDDFMSTTRKAWGMQRLLTSNPISIQEFYATVRSHRITSKLLSSAFS